MIPEPHDLRTSDAERESVVEALREHAAAGRLDADELEERLGAAYAAQLRADLVPLVADLPVAAPAPAPAPAPRPRRPRRPRPNVPPLVVVSVMLIAIWALSGMGYFWPVWPIGAMALGALGGGGCAPGRRHLRRTH